MLLKDNFWWWWWWWWWRWTNWQTGQTPVWLGNKTHYVLMISVMDISDISDISILILAGFVAPWSQVTPTSHLPAAPSSLPAWPGTDIGQYWLRLSSLSSLSLSTKITEVMFALYYLRLSQCFFPTNDDCCYAIIPGGLRSRPWPSVISLSLRLWWQHIWRRSLLSPAVL